MNVRTRIAAAAVAVLTLGAVGAAVAGPATAASGTTATQPTSGVHQVHHASTLKSSKGMQTKTLHRKAEEAREDMDRRLHADHNDRRADKKQDKMVERTRDGRSMSETRETARGIR